MTDHYRLLQDVKRTGVQPPGAFSSATAWVGDLAIPVALAWTSYSPRNDRQFSRAAINDLPAAHSALLALSQATPALSIPLSQNELLWLRDRFGKPYIALGQATIPNGSLPENAVERRALEHLHVSNSHDGGMEFVLSAADGSLRGIGLDIVHLPRLRRPGKDRSYFERFAGQFMSDEELEYYLRETRDENEHAMSIRTAAHFSIMEAASKALGTGLKLGAGMGGEHSLPKRSIAVGALEPTSATLSFDLTATARMVLLGGERAAAYWGFDDEFVVSAVIIQA